jgi:hypothetical protein
MVGAMKPILYQEKIPGAYVEYKYPPAPMFKPCGKHTRKEKFLYWIDFALKMLCLRDFK